MAVPPSKSDMAPILQQLNLTALRTRMLDLHATIARITNTIRTNPSVKWADVLGQFSVVNVELLSLVEDIKPILRAFVVHPKNVTATNAPILPIMLSSKLLPEIEAEEAALKEQVLTPFSNLPLHVQTEKLQKQIELVRMVCDTADKVLADSRKGYGLGTRQGVPQLATIDKVQAAKILEQEKQLYGAANFGESLKNPTDPRSTTALPPHIAMTSAYNDDGYTRAPQTTGLRPATPQQVQVVQGPSTNGAPAAALYANSPRPVGLTELQTQQHQHQQQQQQTLLMHQKAKIQKSFQQQQQHVRQPPTPPLSQMQVPLPNQVTQTLTSKMHQYPQLHMSQQQIQQERHYQMSGRPITAYNLPHTNMAQQARMQYGAQSQRLDPMYLTGNQSVASLGLPLQQQLSGQAGYNLINPNQSPLLNSATNAYIPNHSNMLGQVGMMNPNNMQTFNVRQQQPHPQQQPPTQ